MFIFRKEYKNVNATMFRRGFTFIIDTMFSNIIRVLLLNILIFTRGRDIIMEFLNKFKTNFPDFTLGQLQDFHIRFIANDKAFNEIFYILCIILFSGIIYNLICYFIFKTATIGQKITGLRIIQNNDARSEMSVIQKIARSILNPLPYILGTILFFFFFINTFGFTNFMPRDTLIQKIVYSVSYISNIYVLTYYFVFIIFVWMNVYVISNRFFPHDIITKTRTVDKYDLVEDIEAITKEKDLVDRIDEFVPFFKTLFNFGKKIIMKCINIIKTIINKNIIK